MEEEPANVFVSEVPVNKYDSTELYELLETPVAQPIPRTDDKLEITNTSVIRTEKLYASRKTYNVKVKTVQHVRKEFEEYVNEYLPNDLAKQHRYIFDKIKRGSSKEEQMIERAKKIIHSNNPMKRLTWQMLTNMNAEGHAYSNQYVLWNGKTVRVNGSKGGTKQLLCNFDVGAKIEKCKMSKNNSYKKNGLLKASLNVKFKPGPLTKKENLDKSFQKYTIGATALMPLPEIGLEVSTACGVPLHPSLYGYIQNSRDINGILTDDWVNFALSSLDKNESDNAVTFKLKYRNNQKRILMRDNNTGTKSASTPPLPPLERDSTRGSAEYIQKEIQDILNDLLTAVEINQMQDSLIIDDNEHTDTSEVEKSPSPQKEKITRHAELKKLDVTIIHVNDTTPVDESECLKPYCSMGCVCQSLESKLRLRNHCTRAKCMFECTCNYKKYCVNDDSFNDYITGLINLDKNISSNLAKEEKKFHQTVVFTEGKSIVLSSKRRSARMTKKYEEYVNTLHGNTHEERKELWISLPQIDCTNVEQWCMVHELYRCFCRGKFVSSPIKTPCAYEDQNITIASSDIVDDLILTNKSSEGKKIEPTRQTNENACEDTDEVIDVLSVEPPSGSKMDRHYSISSTESEVDLCSRTTPLCELIRKKHVSTNRENKKTSVKLLSKNFALWLEKYYISLKRRMNEGREIKLGRPVPKRYVIFPWKELLARYRNEDNHLLMHREPPHQVVVTDTSELQDFANYTNIKHLKPEQISNLPEFVKNIVNHNTDMVDVFVLLRGSFNCWEILGYVSKKNEKAAIPISSLHQNPHGPDMASIPVHSSTESLVEKHTTNNDNRASTSLNLPTKASTPDIADSRRAFRKMKPKCKRRRTLNENVINQASTSLNFPSKASTSTDIADSPKTIQNMERRSKRRHAVNVNVMDKASTSLNLPIKASTTTDIADSPRTIQKMEHKSKRRHTINENVINQASASLNLLTKASTSAAIEDSHGAKRRHTMNENVTNQASTSLNLPTKASTSAAVADSRGGPHNVKRKINKRNRKPCLKMNKNTIKIAPNKLNCQLETVNNCSTNGSSSRESLQISDINGNKNTIEGESKTNKQNENPDRKHDNKMILKSTIHSLARHTQSTEDPSHSSRRKQNFFDTDEQRRASDESMISNQTANNITDVNSKWFVMTLENDFLQLKFYKKNVFVTYKTIISAIELARHSEQTVILPLCKMKTYNETGPQFGIYAMPVKDRLCVLVGPYERDEELCMKTVKNPHAPITDKRTRGIWLNTKKVDNSNILEDPLSYLPEYSNKKLGIKKVNSQSEDSEPINTPSNSQDTTLIKPGVKRSVEDKEKPETAYKIMNKGQPVSFEHSYHTYLEKNSLELQTTAINKMKIHKSENHTSTTDCSKMIPGGVTLQTLVVNPTKPATPVKVVKPITIKRSNGFYQLAPSGHFKQVSLLKSPVKDNVSCESSIASMLAPSKCSNPIITSVTSLAVSLTTTPPFRPLIKNISPVKFKSILRPSIESVPAMTQKTGSNKGGFIVLNPDEINNKAIQLQTDCCDNAVVEAASTQVTESFNFEADVGMKFADLYSTTTKSNMQHASKLNNESLVHVPSDKEPADIRTSTPPDDTKQVLRTPSEEPEATKEVMIVCSNVPNLGCIRGHLNAQNQVSFKFPGFKFTEFYTMEEASTKINKALLRKVFVPKSIHLVWTVGQPKESTGLLTLDQLSPDFVVTRRGLIPKTRLHIELRKDLDLVVNKKGQIVDLKLEENE